MTPAAKRRWHWLAVGALLLAGVALPWPWWWAPVAGVVILWAIKHAGMTEPLDLS